MGSYTYGGAQLHAATSVGSGYTAAYDAAGDMVCHAPSSGITCAGSSPTGETLGYDSERQLTSWQSAPSLGPVTTAQYAYDGEGHRVAQSVTAPGGSTTRGCQGAQTPTESRNANGPVA